MDRQRQLNDILQDPDASWSQIREAMKSSRGCTNAAIMGAIASGRGVTVVPRNDRQEQLTDSDVDGDTEASTLSVGYKGENPSCGEKERIVEATQIPLKDNAPAEHGQQEDITNSQNRRPARRSNARRRGGSHRRSKSSIAGSINLMDFGVSHDNIGMSTLVESASFDGEILNRRSSISDNSVFSDSGFLGWNHSDCSLHSSVRTNYSDLVDSSGFLDWERKNHQHSPPYVTPTCIEMNGPTTSEVGGRRNSLSKSFASLTSPFANGQQVEQWNIEDYENPQDNMVDSRRRRGNFFTSHLKRLSGIDQSATPTHTNKKDEINMNDIKEALIKVANSAGDVNKSAPTSRRCSVEPDFQATNNKDKIPRRKRRQTVIGVPSFLGGNEGSDAITNKKETMSIASMHGGCKTVLGRSEATDDTDVNMKGHREAIRINRQDGDVDIEKECRKLYSEEQDDKKEQKGYGFRRRSTLFGADTPKLSAKGTRDWLGVG